MGRRARAESPATGPATQRRQKMVVSKRYTNAKSGKYSSKITKRNESKEAKKYPFTVGPIVLAFFLFVVLGSSVLEIFLSIGRSQGAGVVRRVEPVARGTRSR